MPQKMPKKKRAASTKTKSSNSPSGQSCLKTRSRRYAKLDIVEGGSVSFTDDNKENIKPGETSASHSRAVVKTEKTKHKSSKTHFTDSSHRTNII